MPAAGEGLILHTPRREGDDVGGERWNENFCCVPLDSVTGAQGSGGESRQHPMMRDSSMESGLDSHVLHCFNSVRKKYVPSLLLSIFETLTT